jgi:hypothetical protein
MADVLIFASSLNFADLEAEKNMSSGNKMLPKEHCCQIKYFFLGNRKVKEERICYRTDN